VFFGASCLISFVPSPAQAAPQIVQVNAAQLWQRLEFRVTNVPTAPNPFDPDIIRVDAAITLPSGGTMTVPGFWFQDYQRGMLGGYEVLSQLGSPEWRVRFAPPETGTYSVSLTVRTNGQLQGSPAVTNFTVGAGVPPAGSGYVRIAAANQYFETGDGQALRLIGENVCWHGGRGTYDYDDWFPAMQAAGENYARLWMCPWAFGIETDANSLTHYRLDQAWRLDYVFQLAEPRRIFLTLCLDYHGMFEVTPDYWGGNNFWGSNPYCVTNGGPCVNQNAFFTNTTAQAVYQKRLRYLVARYGYSPNLLVWQFFNEIDNVYAYLNPNDVAAWHGVMGGWLHTNDPFRHLVSTSLTGSSDRPEMWTVPQLDFATYHSYSEPSPALRLNAVAQSFLQRYGKPVLIDEFGTDWRGWNRTNDRYLRGWRQGLWGGALGGSAGTAMSWYWETIHNEDDYPVDATLGAILNRTGWGRGAWTNISFRTQGSPPATVGDLLPGGQPFDAFLALSGVWAGMPSGRLAIPNATAAGYSASALNSFVHGIWHADLKVPFQMSAWLTNDARLVMHLNSVSEGSILVVKSDAAEMFRTNLPNLDGTYAVNNEYNLDLAVNLPAGKHLIEITNAGNDWLYLDWVRLERVQPASYSGDWAPSPDAIGLRGPRESLLYVVAPGASFPGGATNATLPLQQGRTVTLANWPAGRFFAEWYDPATGALVGYSQAGPTNGDLTLPLPDFRDDLAGIVYGPPALTAWGAGPNGAFGFRLDSETGGRYFVERSSNLSTWTIFDTVTNGAGTTMLADPSTSNNSRVFFRARQIR
jgi:hypothetical protein